MHTAKIQLDAPLKRRIAKMAKDAGRTPHSLMVEALEKMADELESHAAFAKVAASRDLALQAGQESVAWHDMRFWLRDSVKGRTAGSAQSTFDSKLDR